MHQFHPKILNYQWNLLHTFSFSSISGESATVWYFEKIVSPKQPRAILLCYNSLDPVSCGVRPERFIIKNETIIFAKYKPFSKIIRQTVVFENLEESSLK